MPAFMVPRYIEFLDNPERTEAMQRIKKPQLRENPLNERTWDAHRPALTDAMRRRASAASELLARNERERAGYPGS